MDSNFLEYNALDSACMVQIRDAFWEDMQEQGFGPAYQMTIDLLPVLTFMQTRGIKVDMEAMLITKAEILASAATKQEELNKLCGRELNVNSSKDCQKYFYVELGITPYYNEGKVTVDDAALQRLTRGTAKRAGLRQAKLVQDIRGLQKLHGTYLDIEFDSDQRLRCSYNPRGTKFGRLSSSKTIFGTGTNQQNLPQEFKKFLVADPGYVLWEVDKRQAEWVVVAYLSQDANMMQVVEEGKDTHIHTAALTLALSSGFEYEQCWKIIEHESKLVGMNSDPEVIAEIRANDDILKHVAHLLPRTMSARQSGKKRNHALNYDETYRTYALINEIEEAEAKRDVEMYHQIYPGIRTTYYEDVKRKLSRERSLTNCFGRKVRFMDAWAPDLWKAAYSMLPQSSVVDSLNQGMVRIYDSDLLCGSNGTGCDIDILAQVHDSILMQIPIEILRRSDFVDIRDRVFSMVSPTLTYHERSFTIATDMKLGLNWGGYNKTTNPNGMREVKDLNEIPKILGELGGPRTPRLD